jgi:hypothetical protein
MFLLPKGNPLYENIAGNKVKLPEVLEKLQFGGFTGYLHFRFVGVEAILIFEGGKLISAKLEKGATALSALEAIVELCSLIVSEGGTLSVFRLSKDLTMGLHALVQGEMLYRAQEVKLIDIKGLLEKMKTDQLNGCLRIYTEDRTAIIFYKEGSPLGFFHDGSQDIETSASESQKIAALPGAKIDVLSTKSAEELMGYDMMDVVNVAKLWDAALAKHQAAAASQRLEAEEREKKAINAKLGELEEDLKEIVVAYVGKVGRTMVEKELNDQGGRQCLLDKDGLTKFMAGVEKSAKLLTSMTKLQEMLKTIESEVASRTAG